MWYSINESTDFVQTLQNSMLVSLIYFHTLVKTPHCV